MNKALTHKHRFDILDFEKSKFLSLCASFPTRESEF